MVSRVAVFVDYQNVYNRAREAFGLKAGPHWGGQVHPYALGFGIAQLGVAGHQRHLSEVRVYRGLPDARRDPKGNAACNRQLDFWESLPRVTAWKRPLQYPPHGSPDRPREKGIDVKLAIDLVMGAVHNEYDCAVVLSADTDLVPAIDAVLEARGTGAVEVATWQPNHGWASRLQGTRHKVWCHYLDEAFYRRVADPHDYTKGPRPRNT